MKYILSGGGDPPETVLVDNYYRKLLMDIASHPGPDIGFVAHAIAPKDWSFEEATHWLMNRDAFRDLQVETIKNLDAPEAFSRCKSVFLMGGNTFRLAQALRQSGVFQQLAHFDAAGIVYGCSAGAIMAGHSISTATLGKEADANDVGLEDLRGLNLAGGFDVLTHFTPDDLSAVRDHIQREKRGVICIPENSGGVLTDGRIQCLGPAPITVVTSEARVDLYEGQSSEL